MNSLSRVAASAVTTVRYITRKYSKPHIEMTPFVNICLLALRIYLITLVGLLVYSFIVTVNQ